MSDSICILNGLELIYSFKAQNNKYLCQNNVVICRYMFSVCSFSRLMVLLLSSFALGLLWQQVMSPSDWGITILTDQAP